MRSTTSLTSPAGDYGCRDASLLVKAVVPADGELIAPEPSSFYLRPQTIFVNEAFEPFTRGGMPSYGEVCTAYKRRFFLISNRCVVLWLKSMLFSDLHARSYTVGTLRGYLLPKLDTHPVANQLSN